MKIFALVILTLLPAIGRAGAPRDCDFFTRAEMGEFMREALDEVIGSAACVALDRELGSFTVARFRAYSETQVQSYLVRLARANVPDALETMIVAEEKADPDRREFMVRSKRNNGAFTWHYAFTAKAADGSVIVFAHSANSEKTLLGESSLKAIRLRLTGPSFIARVAKAK